MSEWKKTSCSLCACVCGLEVMVEDNKIIRVRGDKDNPNTQGYCCRKGRSIQYLQHQKDRNLYPMKRVGDEFIRISWDQAISEICEKLKVILKDHGPRALAGQGFGGFYGFMHRVMARQFIGALGSQAHFNALAAELTGVFWSSGSMFGNQSWMMGIDEDKCEVMVASGWNPYVTHQILKGKEVVKEFATNPEKFLITIDPRRTETARMSDFHLAIKPGTDALLWRAMVALVLQEGWQNKEYIEKNISDFDKILPWFEGVDVKEYCKSCELDYEDVYKVTHLMATKKCGLHSDLGVICGRHSTLTTHLQHVFLGICGKIMTPGGMMFSRTFLNASHTDINDTKLWRTTVTDFPQIIGLFPPAVLAEEIDNDNPNRIRALFCENSNPVQSVVDTKATIKAFEKLDLLVTMDCSFTETARLADYILPNATGFDGPESGGLSMSFPYIYGQIRQPVLEKEGEILDGVDIWMKLYEGMGLVPPIPESLYKAAEGPRPEYVKALTEYLTDHPEFAPAKMLIMVKTLGRAMGSMTVATAWVMLQVSPKKFHEDCARAGFPEGPAQMEMIFQSLMKHPEGIFMAKMDMDTLLDNIETEDGKIHLFAKELDDWVYEITPEQEAKALQNDEYPLILNAGRHIEANINHTMRDPEWTKGKENQCVVAINPADAEELGLLEGQLTRVVTDRGEIELPARISRDIRKGSVLIPTGFGFLYNGKRTGVTVNQLTNSKNRDRFAATPYIRYVPCRVEAV